MAASNEPVVSAVLPFYNAPNLELAVNSILQQTFKDFELILIDNASDEHFSDEARKLGGKDSRIRLIHEPKRGVVFAMNRGIKESRGKFIMRMDADDVSFPIRMEEQLQAFNENSDVGVVSGTVIYDGEQVNQGFKVYVDWLNGIKSSRAIELNQFVEFPIANPSMMFKKELFNQYGYYKDGDFPEDYEFFLRLMSENVKMIKVDSPVLKWVDSETRLTRTDPRYNQDAFHKVKAKYLSKWLKKNNLHHPEVLIWGAGRLSRRRSNYLKGFDIRFTKYIDVKARPDVLHYSKIPVPGTCFIVSYVSNRGAREEIRTFLIGKGFIEGNDFILAA